MRTRIKICGMTRSEDALAAAEAGADALGFVFYPPSPRHIEIDQAWSIIDVLPAFVTTTALFVNPEPGLVKTVIQRLKIDLLQFHGDESVEFCEQFERPYIKAVRMQPGTNLADLSQHYASAQALLLDTYVKGVPGGTGEAFNWDWVAPSKREDTCLPIILAGGLTAENVGQAVQTVQPWAVDVSGGVEAEPGKKSVAQIQAFVEAVNASART
ncbi:phosphoribosylanthranilate isomerase [Hydrogenovibrio thermophilus]|uniref:N-(5'-phosphoribosyl)anthranilate isomerase n=1 Tax=Hydrogenovibrio thermophilus TaxID=265883 RepID=A0A410H258_9GAMM|nr:phosphoribosylanthranilate isomerase [Hydrogenovibrio thermophilus]QAB14994.1 phosphoribosylanthranilate isomerase [Hydrogenovibrio thermophilus]